MTDPRVTPPRKRWPYLHALLVAAGAGGASFLQLSLAVGLPVTTAALRGLLVGAVAAALSRMFGVIVAKFGP